MSKIRRYPVLLKFRGFVVIGFKMINSDKVTFMRLQSWRRHQECETYKNNWHSWSLKAPCWFIKALEMRTHRTLRGFVGWETLMKLCARIAEYQFCRQGATTLHNLEIRKCVPFTGVWLKFSCEHNMGMTEMAIKWRPHKTVKFIGKVFRCNDSHKWIWNTQCTSLGQNEVK